MKYDYVSLAERHDRVDFAKRAAAHFKEHPEHSTWDDGNPSGELSYLFAVKWSYDKKDPTKVWSVMVLDVSNALLVGDV